MPRLIYTYLYSDMATRLSVQNSIFGVVFFVSMSFSGIVKRKKLKTKYNFDPKALFHVFSLSVIRFVQDLQCKCPGARFSKLPVITGPVKLFCFPFQMGVSKLLKIIL